MRRSRPNRVDSAREVLELDAFASTHQHVGELVALAALESDRFAVARVDDELMTNGALASEMPTMVALWSLSSSVRPSSSGSPG